MRLVRLEYLDSVPGYYKASVATANATTGDQTQTQRRYPRPSPGDPPEHQGHLEMQGILTERCLTSFITSPRRRYGRVDSKFLRCSTNRHFVLQCLLGAVHSASSCHSVYQECLSSLLAASWTPSPGHQTIPCATSRITILWLGP